MNDSLAIRNLGSSHSSGSDGSCFEGHDAGALRAPLNEASQNFVPSASLSAKQLGLLVMKNRRRRLDALMEVHRRYQKVKSVAASELQDQKAFLSIESDKLRALRQQKIELSRRFRRISSVGLACFSLTIVAVGVVSYFQAGIAGVTGPIVQTVVQEPFSRLVDTLGLERVLDSFSGKSDDQAVALVAIDSSSGQGSEPLGRNGEVEVWVRRSAAPYAEQADSEASLDSMDGHGQSNPSTGPSISRNEPVFVVLPDGVTTVESGMSRSDSNGASQSKFSAAPSLLPGTVAQGQVLVGENRYERLGKMSTELRSMKPGASAQRSASAKVSPAKPKEEKKAPTVSGVGGAKHVQSGGLAKSKQSTSGPAGGSHEPSEKLKVNPVERGSSSKQEIPGKKPIKGQEVASSSGLSVGSKIRSTGETVLAVTESGDVITDLRLIKSAEVPAILKGNAK